MRTACFRLMVLSLPLLLTACGDGWEVYRTTEVFPYGNKRTAGSGVVYVRAKMLPEKEVVIEPKATMAPVTEPPPKLESGEKIFTEAQKKGSSVGAPPAKKEKAAEEKKEEKKGEEKKTEAESKPTTKPAEIKDSQEKAAVAPAAGKEEKKAVETPAAAVTPTPAPAPAAAKPVENDAQKMDENSDDAPFKPSTVEPQAGSPSDKESSLMRVPDDTASLDIVEIPEEVALSSAVKNKAIMPAKEIKSPMMDIYQASAGERSLEEIYSNPF